MELVRNGAKIRCEMGACRNLAGYSIRLSRVGIRSRIHVCEECLRELHSLIGGELVPKSIETAKKKV